MSFSADLAKFPSATSVTMNSEGGTATTNVQQGLAKVWSDINAAGNSSNDSFNVSSNDDDNTGDYGVNFTNNMGSANYSAPTSQTYAHNGSTNNFRPFPVNAKTTSAVEVDSGYVDSNGRFIFYDIETNASISINGDLA